MVMGVLNPSFQHRVRISLSATPVFLPGEDKPSRVHMIFHHITEEVTTGLNGRGRPDRETGEGYAEKLRAASPS